MVCGCGARQCVPTVLSRPGHVNSMRSRMQTSLSSQRRGANVYSLSFLLVLRCFVSFVVVVLFAIYSILLKLSRVIHIIQFVLTNVSGDSVLVFNLPFRV